MKKYILTAALVLTPTIAAAVHPEGGVINDIKSEIREGYRQLHEDEAAGNVAAASEDRKQIAEDERRLREAMRYPHRTPEPMAGMSQQGEIYAAPPPPEHDELNDKTDRAAKLNPDRPFNRAASVPNEIR